MYSIKIGTRNSFGHFIPDKNVNKACVASFFNALFYFCLVEG